VHALTRFFDPQAQPSHRDPPLPDFHLSGSRCALALTMRLGALLPRWPPWYAFNQARSRDPGPSELDLAEVATHLSVPALPLAIGHAGPLSTLDARSPVLRARSKRASLQGLSRCRLGPTCWVFPALREPWLSWVLPPWGSPLPCSDLNGSRAIRYRLPRGPPSPQRASKDAAGGWPSVDLSRTSGKAPNGSLLPVPQSFKEQWKLALGLFRDRRPLRGSCPRPARC
jgi:hypothetical protein